MSEYNNPAEEEFLTFSEALEALKDWQRITRFGWNWKNMFAYYVPANEYPAQTEAAKKHIWETVKYRAYIALKTAQWDVATWSPSGSDVLENDWFIL
jgi:hypothetical protein